MTKRFKAKIKAGRGGGAFVEVPDPVIAALGGRGRTKVRATFDGVAYRGSVARMGGITLLGVVKAIREEIDKGPGDTVTVTVRVDREARTVDVPPELGQAMAASAAARAFFETLPYTCRKEYAQWVSDAKRAETRERRAEKAVTLLESGKRL